MLDGGREDLKRTGQKDYFQSYNSQKPEGYGSVKKLMVLKHDFLFRPTMLSNNTYQKELEGRELMRRQCNFTSGGEGGDGCLVVLPAGGDGDILAGGSGGGGGVIGGGGGGGPADEGGGRGGEAGPGGGGNADEAFDGEGGGGGGGMGGDEG